MARVAVTGAAGAVGRESLKVLTTENHEITAITHRDHEDIDSTILDITDSETLVDVLADHDVVIHLAADPNSSAPWESILSNNIEGTYNLLEAARKNEITRVVFASSNHTTMAYNIEDPEEPGSIKEGELTTVHPEDRFRPDSFYGVSKITGEALGSYYALRYGLEIVNLRIGWLLTEDELHEKVESGRSQLAKALWLSPRDCRDAIRQAVSASISKNPLTAHIISQNSDRYLSLTETMQSLGYRPQDDSSEALE